MNTETIDWQERAEKAERALAASEAARENLMRWREEDQDKARTELEKVQRQNAARGEALRMASSYVDLEGIPAEMEQVEAALSPDTGAELLTKEQVMPLVELANKAVALRDRILSDRVPYAPHNELDFSKNQAGYTLWCQIAWLADNAADALAHVKELGL